MSNKNVEHYIQPNWPQPSTIRAFSTTRSIGAICGDSDGLFDSFNLAKHVNDSEQKVDQNRQLLSKELELPSRPLWLEQIHSTVVVEHGQQNGTNKIIRADACYSTKNDQVCVVMTADCLPILFCDKKASWVAATHAGWRGLADGIIQQTIGKYQGDSSDIIAWLGPAISQKHFEIGAEVKAIFCAKNPDSSAYFEPTNSGKFMCDLYSIARLILAQHCIQTYGGEHCTFAEKDNFYSYRRDGETGRMASLIWIDSSCNK